MKTKRVEILTNCEFIRICTISFGIQPEVDPKFDNFYFSHDEDKAVVGKALLEALSRSRILKKDDQDYELLCWSSLKDTRHKTDLEYELHKFKYKNKASLFKNMQCCSVNRENEKTIFSSLKHTTLEGWEGTRDNYRLNIPSDSSPEIVGAAVKYSIARCTGRGADLVSEKLFPDGVPESFEAYLESLGLSLIPIKQ